MNTLLQITQDEETGLIHVHSDVFNIEVDDSMDLGHIGYPKSPIIHNTSAFPHPFHSLSDDLHPALSRKLREWRRTKAQAMNLPAHTILKNDVLMSIANTLPANAEELMDLRGFGKVSLERYGADLLALVKQYVATHPQEDWMDSEYDNIL